MVAIVVVVVATCCWGSTGVDIDGAIVGGVIIICGFNRRRGELSATMAFRNDSGTNWLYLLLRTYALTGRPGHFPPLPRVPASGVQCCDCKIPL